MVTLYKPINKKVRVLHQGFDIVILLVNGKQLCVDISETTLVKRQRPKKFKF